MRTPVASIRRSAVAPRLRQRGATLVNVLLLLVIAAIAAGGWFGWQFLERLSLENQALREDIVALTASQQRSTDAWAKENADAGARLEKLEVELAVRGDTLAALKRGGQRNWLLNEAQALASLAQQRLLLTADIAAAERLLGAADETLARLNDPTMLPARKALAADLEKLRGAKQVDVQGLILQLGALQQQVATLTVPVQARDAAIEEKTPPSSDMKSDVSWWQQFLYTLPVTVRRQAAPLPLPLDAEQASTLRLYLDNALQQAQLSLLQNKPAAFQQAIGQARSALQSWLNVESSDVKHLDASLQRLAQTNAEQALPEIGLGLKAIKGLQAEAAQ
jgi:uroporphyrin-III C-methyltransferase